MDGFNSSSTRIPDRGKSLLGAALPFVRLLEVFSSSFLSALRVILGPDGEVILVDRALSLPGDIENLPEVDVRPDLRPLRIQIAVESLAEFVGGGLVVVLELVDFGNAVVRQGTGAVRGQRLLIFLQGFSE